MSNEIAQITPRKSLLVTMASRYGMEPAAFQSTLKATVMPSQATNEQLAAFLLVAHEYDLNPITREIYAFPARGGGIQPVVGVDGWINLAQRRPEFDGMEFEHEIQGDKLVSCTCKIWRKDRSRPVCVTEYMDECRRSTDPWKSHPRRMLRHKAAIQAIRYAFGFAGIKDEDDAEVIYANATTIDNQPSTAAQSIMQQARENGTSEQQEQHQEQQKQTEEEHDAQQWPHSDGNDWLDSRGYIFNPDVHGWSKDQPAVTKHGHFRMRRGCDANAFVDYEQSEQRRIDGVEDPQSDTADDADIPWDDAGIPGDNEQQEQAAPTFTVHDLVDMARKSKSTEELDEVLDLAHTLDDERETAAVTSAILQTKLELGAQ